MAPSAAVTTTMGPPFADNCHAFGAKQRAKRHLLVGGFASLCLLLISVSRTCLRCNTEHVVVRPLQNDEKRTRSSFPQQHLDHSKQKQTVTATRRRRLLESDEQYQETIRQHLTLFERSAEAAVLGPSAFPKPSDKAKTSPDDEIVVNLKPTLGQHRPEKDAVLILAAEYKINIYTQFIESLFATGFDGDVVLSVHEKDLENKEVKAYLEYYANLGRAVVYSPKQVCFTRENEETHSANGGGRTCQLHHVFGRKSPDSDGSVVVPLSDPRSARTVQNIRYETYWAMAMPYQPTSWIFLVDARDTVFQSDPFASVPRNTDPTGKSGLLYFFGESMEATRIGKSVKYNYRWIKAAYGDEVAVALKDKPTICSGATMGEKVAIDTYLRAMVAEADETGTVMMGSDQGFHNRLYYSNKLQNADSIHSIVLFDQGAGIVNNLAALRSKELDQWGNGKVVETNEKKERVVKNWDGTRSPVVHQFDRHKELATYFSRTLQPQLYRKWKKKAGRA